MPLRIMQIGLASAQPPIHSRPMQNFDDWVDLKKVDIAQAYFPCSTPDERALAYTVRQQCRRFAVPEAQATGSKIVVMEIGGASLLRKVLEIGLKAGIMNKLRNLIVSPQQLFHVKPSVGLTLLAFSCGGPEEHKDELVSSDLGSSIGRNCFHEVSPYIWNNRCFGFAYVEFRQHIWGLLSHETF
jgi:hypothetical protein